MTKGVPTTILYTHFVTCGNANTFWAQMILETPVKVARHVSLQNFNGVVSATLLFLFTTGDAINYEPKNTKSPRKKVRLTVEWFQLEEKTMLG